MSRQPARVARPRPALNPARLWIDTDVGDNPDDAVTLLLAASHPGVDLAGVSVVGEDRARRAGEAHRLLPSGVPVVAEVGEVGEVGEVADWLAVATPDALLAIGPLTNVAAVVESGVAVPPRCAVMGGALGAVRHRGRLRRVESNVAADVSAARRVLADVRPLTLVPLDVTARAVLPAEAVDRLVAAQPLLADPIGRWDAPVCLHDPLALLVLLGDVETVVERRRLSVAADGRLVEADEAPPIDVVVAADVSAALARIGNLLGADLT